MLSNAENRSSPMYSPVLGAPYEGPFLAGGGAGPAREAAHGPFVMKRNRSSGAVDVVENWIVFGRTAIHGDDARGVVPVPPSGYIVAEIRHGSSPDPDSPATLSVRHVDELPHNTLDLTYVPLYRASGQGAGATWTDLRWMPTVCGLE